MNEKKFILGMIIFIALVAVASMSVGVIIGKNSVVNEFHFAIRQDLCDDGKTVVRPIDPEVFRYLVPTPGPSGGIDG